MPSVQQHPISRVRGRLDAEEERIVREYERRDRLPLVHGFRSQPELLSSHARERAIYRALARAALLPLDDKQIVDFGCGVGARLRDMMRLGAGPENLHGVDLSETRLAHCRRLSPNMQVVRCSAADTPYESGRFDLVINSTMMSSVLDDALAAAIAREMVRVLKPQGAILWCDLRYRNPWNSQVRPYRAADIRRLFPGWKVRAESFGMPPQLSRLLGNCSWLYGLLHLAPPLRSSLAALIHR